MQNLRSGPDAPSERSLVQDVARGDEAAATKLFRLHGESVLRFVYRRVGEQMEDAEEVTLDTFGSAVKMAATFDSRSSVFTWLCGIAKVRIVDFYRRTGRDKRIPIHLQTSLEGLKALETKSLDRVLDELDARRIVDEILVGLTEDEREALMLRYVEQLSVKEIATLMKRSEKGVEALLTRAKKKPRQRFERWAQGGMP